jgi:hypothetical protein
VQPDPAEDARALALKGAYDLPDDDVLLVATAMARQLSAMRTSGVPHKGLIVVNQVPGGIDRAEYVAALIEKSQVRESCMPAFKLEFKSSSTPAAEGRKCATCSSSSWTQTSLVARESSA